MKTLLLFGALVLFGWTALAAGVLACLSGEPAVSMQSHHHVEPVQEVAPSGPLLSDCPDQALDASVPCSA